MAIPTDYIFTRGTVAKNGVFDLIVNSLTAAGWQPVASLPSADGTVLKSTGNNEDKALIINIRDTNAANANSVKTTNYNTMSYRLQDTYTPGAVGVAGVFGRPSLAWTALDIVPTVATTGTLAQDTTLTYSVYADKSKIILALEYPSATNYSPLLIYLGAPDSIWASDSLNTGCLLATTVNATSTASSLYICNTSDGMGSVTAPYTLSTYSLVPPGDPNMGGKRMVASIYYGNTSEGYRGKLDGIKCLLNSKINTGDTVTIGAETYYTLVCHSQGNSSFPTGVALLIRTA